MQGGVSTQLRRRASKADHSEPIYGAGPGKSTGLCGSSWCWEGDRIEALLKQRRRWAADPTAWLGTRHCSAL